MSPKEEYERALAAWLRPRAVGPNWVQEEARHVRRVRALRLTMEGKRHLRLVREKPEDNPA